MTEVKTRIAELLFCVCIHDVVSAQHKRTSLCNAVVITSINLMAGMCIKANVSLMFVFLEFSYIVLWFQAGNLRASEMSVIQHDK